MCSKLNIKTKEKRPKTEYNTRPLYQIWVALSCGWTAFAASSKKRRRISSLDIFKVHSQSEAKCSENSWSLLIWFLISELAKRQNIIQQMSHKQSTKGQLRGKLFTVRPKNLMVRPNSLSFLIAKVVFRSRASIHVHGNHEHWHHSWPEIIHPQRNRGNMISGL